METEETTYSTDEATQEVEAVEPVEEVTETEPVETLALEEYVDEQGNPIEVDETETRVEEVTVNESDSGESVLAQ